MKIIFAAFRHDPLNVSKRQGADRQFLDALNANGCDCKVVGPFNGEINILERLFRRIIKQLSNNAYMKHDLTNICRTARSLDKIFKHMSADLVFSLYPASLAFYGNKTPCVFRTDATIKGVLKESPQFLSVAPLLRWFALWIEKRALHRSILIITHSEWSRNILKEDYGISPEKIFVMPNPSSLPATSIPDKLTCYEEKNSPLKLLFIGQDPKRKGLDVSLKVVDELNHAGIKAVLTICGLTGESTPTIHYAGKLHLDRQDELGRYTDYLSESHLLLHPALFDPAPRVTAEAAAFGTPTITNNTGGLGTSVLDGVSGIVLPKGSPAEAYVQAIIDLVNDPERYRRLCQTTRERYEKELNWDVAGKRLVSVLEEAVKEHNAKRMNC